MMRTIMPRTIALLASLLLLIPSGAAHAQDSLACGDGDVISSPPTLWHVTVGDGVSCTLDGAALHGSVIVEGGSVTIRDSDILGDVRVSDTAAATRLVRSNVYGTVSIDDAGPVLIDRGALADVAVSHSSGAVEIRHAELGGSLSIDNGSGKIMVADVEGTELTDLMVVEHVGSIEVTDSDIGDFTVRETGRPVILTGVFVDGDVTVAESGRVEMQRSESGRPSALDGDLEISDVDGKVRILDITTAGDVSISGSGAIAFRGNDSSNENVELLGNSGPVLVEGNVRLGLTVGGNGEVGVYGNSFTEADVSGNSGSVEIAGNAFDSLLCEGNAASPEDLGGNSVGESADGQCAGF